MDLDHAGGEGGQAHFHGAFLCWKVKAQRGPSDRLLVNGDRAGGVCSNQL